MSGPSNAHARDQDTFKAFVYVPETVRLLTQRSTLLDHMSAWGRGDPSHSMQVTRVAPGWPVPSLMHRRRVMADRITYVGLDVHKESIVVAVAAGGLRGEVREYGRIANTAAALDRLMRKLGAAGVGLRFCYEAGPCGYGIQRHLSAHGHECVVVAASLIPKRAGRA